MEQALGFSAASLEKQIRKIIGEEDISTFNEDKLRRALEKELSLEDGKLDEFKDELSPIVSSIVKELSDSSNKKEEQPEVKGQDEPKAEEQPEAKTEAKEAEPAAEPSNKRKRTPSKTFKQKIEEVEEEEEEEEEESEEEEALDEDDEEFGGSSEEEKKKKQKKRAPPKKKVKPVFPIDPRKSAEILQLKKVIRQSLLKTPKGLTDHPQEEQIQMLKEVLIEAGLGVNPNRKQIQEFRSKKEAERDSEGIDSSNIIEGGRRTRMRRQVSYVYDVKIDDLSESEEEEPQPVEEGEEYGGGEEADE